MNISCNVRPQVNNNKEEDNNKKYTKTRKNTKEMVVKLRHGIKETLNNALPSTHVLSDWYYKAEVMGNKRNCGGGSRNQNAIHGGCVNNLSEHEVDSGFAHIESGVHMHADGAGVEDNRKELVGGSCDMYKREGVGFSAKVGKDHSFHLPSHDVRL